MKNFIMNNSFLMAILIAFAFTLFACSSGGGGGDGPEISGVSSGEEETSSSSDGGDSSSSSLVGDIGTSSSSSDGNPVGGSSSSSEEAIGGSSSSSEEAISSSSALAAITSVSIHVVAPATGETPSGTATTTEAGYSVGAVQWSPSGSKFLGGTVYTATVTLTASEGYTFTGLASAKNINIDGHSAAITGNTGGTVTLSYAFTETPEKEVSGISIKTQPSKLAYTHGETLDLSGLEVTLTYNDGTSEDVASSDFEGKNIETEPYHKETLLHPSHDGKGVKVEYGGQLSANTANLSVAFPVSVCGTTEYNPSEKLCDDRDDKLYNHVTITIDTYSETWMAENLNYAATNSRCYGDRTGDDNENCDTYGRLYNFATASDNVCPSGWHLSSDAEWAALVTAVGGNPGAKLKTTSGWTDTSGNGTDDYGFSALPGGMGYTSSFGSINSGGNWWSPDGTTRYYRTMSGNGDAVNRYSGMASDFMSVRCIQD